MKEVKINIDGKILGEERFTTEDGKQVRMVFLKNMELPTEMREAENNVVKIFQDHIVKRIRNTETGEVKFEIL